MLFLLTVLISRGVSIPSWQMQKLQSHCSAYFLVHVIEHEMSYQNCFYGNHFINECCQKANF